MFNFLVSTVWSREFKVLIPYFFFCLLSFAKLGKVVYFFLASVILIFLYTLCTSVFIVDIRFFKQQTVFALLYYGFHSTI